MAQDSLKSIFSLLHDYLYVADVFNLSCALAYPHSQWPRADVALVTRTLDVPPRVPLVRFLCTYMRRPRCRQCGKTCHAVHPRYCRGCTRDDPGSPVLMVDRVYVVRTHRGVRGRKSRFILDRARVVKRGGNQAHLFLLREVEALARQFDDRQTRQTHT